MIKANQPSIYENILDLEDKYDTFFFDAYGVFWDGDSLYPGAAENMEQLIKDNKHIYIVSNSPKTSDESEIYYEQKGLKKGVNYNSIITSGEALNRILRKRISSKIFKVYIWCARRSIKLLDMPNIETIIVDNPLDADYIYISVPLITKEEVKKYGLVENKTAFLTNVLMEGENKVYNCISQDVFSEKVDELLTYKKPFIFANVDEKVPEKTVDNKVYYPVRQGAILKMLIKRADELSIKIDFIASGKPYNAIYDCAFELMKQDGLEISKDKIVMVGDTVGTDILGGKNAGINTCLCLFTGNARNIIYNKYKKENTSLSEENFFKLENNHILQLISSLEVRPDVAIKAVGNW